MDDPEKQAGNTAPDEPQQAEDNNQPAGAAAAEKPDQEKPSGSATNQNGKSFPPLRDIPVDELYDHDKYDLSTMEPTDVFRLLE